MKYIFIYRVREINIRINYNNAFFKFLLKYKDNFADNNIILKVRLYIKKIFIRSILDIYLKLIINRRKYIF